MVLGLQMYSGDYDDKTVFEYGYFDGSSNDPNIYHYNTTWVGRIYPYVKSNSIFFDKTMPEITNYNQLYQDPNYSSNTYTYTWNWITSFSLNTDGYSEQLYTGSSCTNYGSYNNTPTSRSQTAIDQPSARLAVTPTRYGNIPNWSWMRFISYYAAWPVADAYATGFSWNQLVYDARKQYGMHFVGGFADGHAGKYGPEKFVKQYVNNPSQSQATSYTQWCNVMDQNHLFDFWGPYWSGS